MKNNVVVLVSVLLLGCQANDESLIDFIRDVETQARDDVIKLKPATAYQVVPYKASVRRTPFALPKEVHSVTQPMTTLDCWQPTSRASSEQLEHFPLERLRLKGVIGMGAQMSGLIQVPSGKVYRVQTGEYIGQNNGFVASISSDHLLINETLPDGLGCWKKRKVTLALK